MFSSPPGLLRNNDHVSARHRSCSRGLLFAIIAAALLTPSFGHSQSPPSNFDDLATQAAAARDQQDLPLAIDLYTKAEALKSDWAEGWWNLGLLDYTTKQYASAIDALNHLLQLNPRVAPAMAIRGLCEFQTAAYDDSLRDLEQAAAHGAANDPRHEQIIRYHLGLLLTRAGRFYDALGQYKQLAAKHDDDPDLPLAIGMAGMRAHGLPQEIDAQQRELYGAAGNAAYAFMADDSEGADAQFTQLFARYPTAPNLHYFYGFLLFPHDRGIAANQFRLEVTIDPANELAVALQAFTLMYLGRYAEALPLAESALAAEPGMEMAQLVLGRSLVETGDEKHGIELLNQVVERDPNSLEAHLGLLAAYTHAGRSEDAYRERKVCLGLVK
jgi:tetratricopeptide (TPR) repeat protein